MPISLAETDEAIAEERRLLYVGITRAREHLELSYARSRNPGGRASRRRTRFLDGLWPDENGQRRRAPGSARSSASTLSGQYDPVLFERLRDWRAEVALDTDKPAYTVIVDATLAAIAEIRPTTTAELAQVKGIGPAKIDRYGPAILALVAGRSGT